MKLFEGMEDERDARSNVNRRGTEICKVYKVGGGVWQAQAGGVMLCGAYWC
jgi:hypothetical protein